MSRVYRHYSEERAPPGGTDDTHPGFKQTGSGPAAAAESAPSTAAAPPTVEGLLDALTSLLVEKRLITREELAAQLRSVQDGAARSRSRTSSLPATAVAALAASRPRSKTPPCSR